MTTSYVKAGTQEAEKGEGNCRCYICGLAYDSNLARDRKIHEKYHKFHSELTQHYCLPCRYEELQAINKKAFSTIWACSSAEEVSSAIRVWLISKYAMHALGNLQIGLNTTPIYQYCSNFLEVSRKDIPPFAFAIGEEIIRCEMCAQ